MTDLQKKAITECINRMNNNYIMIAAVYENAVEVLSEMLLADDEKEKILRSITNTTRKVREEINDVQSWLKAVIEDDETR